jgi:hypothetical protein
MSAAVTAQKRTLRVSNRLLAIAAVLVVLSLVGVANAFISSPHPSGPSPLSLDTSVAYVRSDATSSAWYCAGPLPIGTQPEYSAISVANVSARGIVGELVVVSTEGGVTRERFSVGADAQAVLHLPSVGPRTFSAATVLVNSANIGVNEILERPSGPIATPCVSHDAPNAYVAAGSTKGASNVDLSLYDPSATPAVASVTFATSSGLVSPPAYQGIPVGSGEDVVLDVGHFVPQREVVAAMVSSIGGHIVVGALDTMDVAPGVDASLLTATPVPASTWMFSGAPAGSSTRQGFYVLNPGTKAAHVALDVTSPSGTASVDLNVAPQSSTLVGLAPDPDPLALRWVNFATSEKTPIVVARTTTILQAIPTHVTSKTAAKQKAKKLQRTAATPASGATSALLLPGLAPGFAITTATSAPLRSWLLAGGEVNTVTSELVLVTNPSDKSAHVALLVLGALPDGSLAKHGLGELTKIVVLPHETTSVNLGAYFANRSALALEVHASEPVLAGSALYARGSNGSVGFNASAGIPVG